MKNFKLDIEDQLWSYFEKEDAFVLLSEIFETIPENEPTEAYLQDCTEVTNPEHPLAKICFELMNQHPFPVEVDVKVFNSGNSNISSRTGCFMGDDYLYFYCHPAIFKVLSLLEVSYLFQHETGHYFSRTTVNPVTFIQMGSSLSIVLPDENEKARFLLLANMLSQINEYNADRFAVFATGDVAGYISVLRKIDAYYQSIELQPEVRQQVIRLRNSGWKGRYTTTHPFAEDRISALQYLEDHVRNADFDINKTPEVYHQILKLLNYNEFMSEFGEYYEQKLSTQIIQNPG